MNISCNNVSSDTGARQLSMFDEIKDEDRKVQEAELAIKEKFGKNAILKGTNLARESTAMERNRQIGGHKSGE